MEGRYSFRGTVMLNGKFKGEISSGDTLIIGERAVLEADVRAGRVTVSGEVTGNLRATERKLLALWEAIERATQRQEFPPRPSKLCGWCDHQALCPSFGGTPPPFPAVVPGPEPLPAQRVTAAP